MTFATIWFVLWGILWAVYFVLDGFDFGAGILMNFIAKNDLEKRQVINSIGPFWDGNEVWLITAGGATFAAFPTTYAYMFSYLYSALLIILFGLIFRGVSFEFRGKEENPRWKRFFDLSIFLGSLIPALLFGVAFGNIFKGLPIDAEGYHGSLLQLLNFYGLLTGILFLSLFLYHGGLYLSLKTEGEVQKRAIAFSRKFFIPLFVIAFVFLIFTPISTKLMENYFKVKILFLVPLLLVLSLILSGYFTFKNKVSRGFLFSFLTILLTVITGIIGLYPNLIPSSLDQNYSLTIFNSSSSEYTLKIMTIVAFIFVPIVIIYQIWVYRLLRGKVRIDDILKDENSY